MSAKYHIPLTIRNLRNQHDQKHTLTTDLANHIGTTNLANHIGSNGARKEAKERIAAYRLALKRDDDSDCDDKDNPYHGSQESLIESIVKCETFIAE
jgi:hypothetical protein